MRDKKEAEEAAKKKAEQEKEREKEKEKEKEKNQLMLIDNSATKIRLKRIRGESKDDQIEIDS